MKKTISLLDRKGKIKYPNTDEFDLIGSKRKKYLGIILLNDILFIKYPENISFRAKWDNILNDNHLLALKSLKSKIDRDFLNNYFFENEDNPYAVLFIIELLKRGINIDSESVVTQFPPLQRSKKKQELDIKKKWHEIIPNLQVGDIVFTYEKASRISQKIVKYDTIPWSHSALIYKDLIIQNLTTSGLIRHPIDKLDPINSDIAFYRPIYRENTFNDTEKELFVKIMDEYYESKIKYSWSGVTKIFLLKKFKFLSFMRIFPSWRIKTGSDMIYSNKLRLIDYI